MNLTRIRQSDFQTRLREVMYKFKFYGDQDVYNHLFAEKDEVYVLPCVWNVRSDSRCNAAGGIGILHGNRKLFHRLAGYFPSPDIRLENFTSNYFRLKAMSWDRLMPSCPYCPSSNPLYSRCYMK